VKKGQNGRKSLRRLKPTVGSNASKRRRRRKRCQLTLCPLYTSRKTSSYPKKWKPLRWQRENIQD
jgi:hypothetical protein